MLDGSTHITGLAIRAGLSIRIIGIVFGRYIHITERIRQGNGFAGIIFQNQQLRICIIVKSVQITETFTISAA